MFIYRACHPRPRAHTPRPARSQRRPPADPRADDPHRRQVNNGGNARLYILSPDIPPCVSAYFLIALSPLNSSLLVRLLAKLVRDNPFYRVDIFEEDSVSLYSDT